MSRGQQAWRTRLPCAALLIILLAGCAGSPSVPPRQIWDVRAGRSIDEATLIDRLAAARLRLLGELHDRAEHHVVRARWIAQLAARGERPVVVLEQFDRDHAASLEAAQLGGVDAEAIADAGQLDRHGWAWPLHKPIVEAAVAAGLPVRAGNLAQADTARIARQGLDPVRDAALAATLASADWPEQKEAAQRREIVIGHCGQLPASVVPRMTLAQRARDAVMAAEVTKHASSGVVLIAGNGHVRRDLGVAAYLPRAFTASVIAVGFVEGPEPAGSDMDPRLTDPAFDYLWISAHRARADPCAAFTPPTDRAGSPRP